MIRYAIIPIALIHTNLLHAILFSYGSSAESKNAQNICSFLKYNHATSLCRNVHSLVLWNGTVQTTFTGILLNIPLSRGERGTQKIHLFVFALQGWSHWESCSLFPVGKTLPSLCYFFPMEKAVTDCRWAPPLLQSPLQGFGLFHNCLVWRCLLRCGLALWPFWSVLVCLADVSKSRHCTVAALHSTAKCFSCPKVSLKQLQSSPFSHTQGNACNSCSFFMCLIPMFSLKSLSLSSKQWDVGIKKGQSTQVTRCSSVTAALSLMRSCRFWIHLTSPCSFREPVLCAKSWWRLSHSSCQDSSPWKLVLLFMS